jgi:hypothetical protein
VGGPLAVVGCLSGWWRLVWWPSLRLAVRPASIGLAATRVGFCAVCLVPAAG